MFRIFFKGDVVRMVWPPQSPDLNPIEAMWDYVDSKLKKNGKSLSRSYVAKSPKSMEFHSASRTSQIYFFHEKSMLSSHSS